MSYKKRGIAALLLAAGLANQAAFAAGHATVRNSQGAMRNRGMSQVAMLTRMANQNGNRTVAPAFNWKDRLIIGGVLNIDAAYDAEGRPLDTNADGDNPLSGVVPNFIDNEGSSVGHSTSIAVNNLNVLMDVKANRYLGAHISMLYRNLGISQAATDWTLDEAFLMFSDFADSPFYAKLGRGFVPFGTYKTPYPVTYSFTELMSITNAPFVEAGYVSPQGIYGSVYAFNGDFSGHVSSALSTVSLSRVRNWGGKIGYMSAWRNVMYHVNAGFLRDYRDTDYFRSLYTNASTYANSRRAGAYALHGYARQGAFDLQGNYVGVTRNIDPTQAASESRSNKPYAYDIQGGYRFTAYHRVSKVVFGFQRSGQQDRFQGVSTDYALRAHMPRYRWFGELRYMMSQYVNMSLQFAHNRDYKDTPFSDNTSNVLNFRVGVHF